MEPITHVLYGAAIARAGLNRVTPLATATVALAAEAPDIDFVVHFFADSVTGFAHHRGITHTFLGAPFIAAGVVGLIYAIQRLVEPLCRGHVRGGPAWIRWARARGKPRWGLLFLFASLGALSHILLDYTNGYGVRPLAPFREGWTAWDTVFIIEPFMWMALVAGLALPALFALVNEEIGARSRGPRGRGGAIFALLAIALLWGVRAHYHDRALTALAGHDYRGAQALRVGAYPYPFNPFLWHGIVETENSMQTMNVDARSGRVDTGGLSRIYFKPKESEVLEAARASRLGRVYLDWAVFPVLDAEPIGPEGRAWQVRFSDLRFRYPTDRRLRLRFWAEPENGPVVLAGHLLLDRNLRVVAETMGSPARQSDYARALERLREPAAPTD